MTSNFKFLILFICFSFQIHSQNSTTEFTIKSEHGNLNIEQALSEYLQFESVSGHEKEAGDWLKGLCKLNGLHVKEMGTTDGNYNFTASIYPLSSDLPNIILLPQVCNSSAVTPFTEP